MKKQLLLLSLFVATSAMAQEGIVKGSIYGGLGLSVYTQKSESESKNGSVTVKQDPVKSMGWEVLPEINYFFMDNMSVGLAVGANGFKRTSSSSQGNTTTDNTYKSSGPTINLNLRKFWNCSDNFYTFAGFGVGIANDKGEDITDTKSNNQTVSVTVKDESKNMNLGLDLGFAYSVTPRVMLMGSFGVLGYYSSTNKYNITENPDAYSQNKSSGIQFALDSRNIPFNLGFLYYINGGGK